MELLCQGMDVAAGTWKEGNGENIHGRQRFNVMTAVGEAAGSGAGSAINI